MVEIIIFNHTTINKKLIYSFSTNQLHKNNENMSRV